MKDFEEVERESSEFIVKINHLIEHNDIGPRVAIYSLCKILACVLLASCPKNSPIREKIKIIDASFYFIRDMFVNLSNSDLDYPQSKSEPEH